MRRAALTIALVLVASSAHAQGVDEDKQRGNQAMSDLNYADALTFYKKALEKNPADASLHYNIGRAYQAQGSYPEALDALEEFQKKASPEMRAKVPALDQLLADVRSRVGSIRLACAAEAPAAQITVGDRTRVAGCGAAPKVVRFAVAGTGKNAPLDVKLEDEKLTAQAARVTVEGGRPPLDVTLRVIPKVSSGILVLRATPASASVSIDGVTRGNPPVEVPLPAASHTAELSADGYEPMKVPFVIAAGEQKSLDLAMDKKAPITTKWWFWTGAAVLVAGAVTVGYILIAQPEKDLPAGGSIAPGTVRQGLAF